MIMADVTVKTVNLCRSLMDASVQLMDAVAKLEALKDEKESSGLDFTTAGNESALAASDLKHASGANFDAVISSGAALKTFLVTNFHDDNFQKVRP